MSFKHPTSTTTDAHWKTTTWQLVLVVYSFTECGGIQTTISSGSYQLHENDTVAASAFLTFTMVIPRDTPEVTITVYFNDMTVFTIFSPSTLCGSHTEKWEVEIPSQLRGKRVVISVKSSCYGTPIQLPVVPSQLTILPKGKCCPSSLRFSNRQWHQYKPIEGNLQYVLIIIELWE